MAKFHDSIVHKEPVTYQSYENSKLTGRTHVSLKQDTTDATATTVYSLPIALSSGAQVEVDAYFLQDDGSEGGRSNIRSSFRRGTSGNVTESGSPTSVTVEDSAGSPVATLVANTSTQAVDVKVTGVASTNLTWLVDIYYKKISF